MDVEGGTEIAVNGASADGGIKSLWGQRRVRGQRDGRGGAEEKN